MKTIKHGQEYMTLHDDGCISRPAIQMAPSGKWKVRGAVRYNNFGQGVEWLSLEQILAPGTLQWLYKNGKQRLHICDLDYGTRRTWVSPNHEVF